MKVLQPCKWIVDTIGKKERALTPNYSREFYPQFLHSKVKLSRITLRSFILILIRKSKISIPVQFQSFILNIPKIRKLFDFTFRQFFFSRIFTRFILSYLILIRVRPSCETNVTYSERAFIFSQKFSPL